jgi:hypothetical protein
MQREKVGDAGDRLVQALMLRRQQQSDYRNTPNRDQIIKAIGMIDKLKKK